MEPKCVLDELSPEDLEELVRMTIVLIRTDE